MYKIQKHIATGLLVVAMIGQTALAEEVLLFSNEVNEQNANRTILDYDDTGGDVVLQFGETLNERLYWDNTNGRFVFTDDLQVNGNVDVVGNITITGTVDGVDVSNLNTTVTNHLDGGSNKHDASEIDVETAGNITTVANLETNLGAIDTAIGDRNYTEDNYVTDGQSISDSIDALDQQVKNNADNISNSNSGTPSNTFTLDTDDTGGNVTLVFGTTVNEYLRHDGTQFSFSDDLLMNSDKSIQFRDADLSINSSVDGQLDIDADVELEIDAPLVDLNGNLDVSGTINGTNLSTTALDFNGNATIGTNGDTLTLESSNWDISSTGTTTGLSIDADTNTITNIDNNDIKAGANIDFSKLATRSKKLMLSMNDVNVEEDGSNNQVNLYSEVEAGANPHRYYLLKSRQASLNDLTLKFKIKLPEDFVSFDGTNDITFSYRNTGVNNTDSKIDILVEDEDGDDAFLAAAGQDLFNTSWTDFVDEFDEVAFNPAAGEYVYITVKGYASFDSGFQSPNIGELVLTYIGR